MLWGLHYRGTNWALLHIQLWFNQNISLFLKHLKEAKSHFIVLPSGSKDLWAMTRCLCFKPLNFEVVWCAGLIQELIFMYYHFSPTIVTTSLTSFYRWGKEDWVVYEVTHPRSESEKWSNRVGISPSLTPNPVYIILCPITLSKVKKWFMG